MLWSVADDLKVPMAVAWWRRVCRVGRGPGRGGGGTVVLRRSVLLLLLLVVMSVFLLAAAFFFVHAVIVFVGFLPDPL